MLPVLYGTPEWLADEPTVLPVDDARCRRACDSAGLFSEGEGFEPKPAWDGFVEVSGGRPSPP